LTASTPSRRPRRSAATSLAQDRAAKARHTGGAPREGHFLLGAWRSPKELSGTLPPLPRDGSVSADAKRARKRRREPTVRPIRTRASGQSETKAQARARMCYLSLPQAGVRERQPARLLSRTIASVSPVEGQTTAPDDLRERKPARHGRPQCPEQRRREGGGSRCTERPGSRMPRAPSASVSAGTLDAPC
jgi:hypothetical protein